MIIKFFITLEHKPARKNNFPGSSINILIEALQINSYFHTFAVLLEIEVKRR